jgi:hypothetical protein
MFLMYETLMLAFIALIAPLFGKLAGYELRRKPFELVAASGLFFLLTVAFGILPLQGSFLTSIWNFLGVISYFIGWLSLFVGAVWELFGVLSIPEAREHTTPV